MRFNPQRSGRRRGKGFGNPEADSESKKFKPELLPQQYPLLGNKENVLDLSRQGKLIDVSLLSDHRLRVIMLYLEEGSEAIGTVREADSSGNVEPIPAPIG